MSQPPNYPNGQQPSSNNQPGFYNQPTSQYRQPGPNQQLPPLPHTRLLAWLRRPSKSRLIVLGILLPFCILSCCIATGVSALSGSQQTQTTTSQQATPTDTPTQDTSLLALTPTDTPADYPTDTPTPSPTATATPTPHPAIQPTPTPRPQPTPTQQHTGVNGNPWGYDFNPGNLIYSPASAFCSYFSCVSTFWTATRGYVAECANGEYTHSAGVSGACSRDGGVSRTLYSH
jgi:hypothetical protein